MHCRATKAHLPAALGHGLPAYSLYATLELMLSFQQADKVRKTVLSSPAFPTDEPRGSEGSVTLPNRGGRTRQQRRRRSLGKVLSGEVRRPVRVRQVERNGNHLSPAAPGRKRPILSLTRGQLSHLESARALKINQVISITTACRGFPKRTGGPSHWLQLKNAVRKCLWRRNHTLDK